MFSLLPIMKNEEDSFFKASGTPIKTANFITKSVNNAFRQKVIALLLSAGKLPVNELCEKLNSEQSVMSQHLAILRKAGLVNTERQGKHVFYSVNEKQLQDIIDCLLYLNRLVK